MCNVTTKTFIENAKAVHQDKFDYTKVVYTRAKDKVLIKDTFCLANNIKLIRISYSENITHSLEFNFLKSGAIK